jgi:shikimate kinase
MPMSCEQRHWSSLTRCEDIGPRPKLGDPRTLNELVLVAPQQKYSIALPSLQRMRRILVTGMSGTGKSSALERLGLLGFRTVDTDESDWTEWSEVDGGYVWREEQMAELLAGEDGPPLYVSGTVSNQGRFYDRFDAVVLLSAPASVLFSRIETRTTNPYGKTAAQRELVRRDLAEVEPRLRRTCTHEIDATQPLADVVTQLADLGRDPSA